MPVLLQAYFLENCVQMQKYENSLFFSNFQLVLLRTSELEFTGIWQVLLGSTSLSALSAAQNLRLSFDFRLLADALEEKSDLQVFWILILGDLKRDLEKKKIGHYGVKISKSFYSLRSPSIVFSSFCRSRKVVWDQSELKNRVGIGLAILRRSRPDKPVPTAVHVGPSS